MRLGPVVGFVLFFAVVGSCVELEADPTPAPPSSTVEVTTITEVEVTVASDVLVETPTTTEELASQSIIVPRDDEPAKDIHCDDAAELCETGAYICDDLTDYCDYGPDDGQDITDEFEWEE
jgi:hypothetical protein